MTLARVVSLSVTVNDLVPSAFGAPLIVPVLALRLSPKGGLPAQVYGGKPPDASGVSAAARWRHAVQAATATGLLPGR